jgi:hypothetical protein
VTNAYLKCISVGMSGDELDQSPEVLGTKSLLQIFNFVNEFGLPIDYGTPTELFAKTRERLELPDQRFHDCRHFQLLSC